MTQLEARFPLLAEDKMFLPALMNYLKKRKVTSIVMGSGNSKLSRIAAAMSDNVVFVWRDKYWEKGIDEQHTKAKNENLLVIYADRCEGEIGTESKDLSIIPIENNELSIGDCNNPGKHILFLNPGCNSFG